MSTTALEFASIGELAALLASKKISPVELTKLYLRRIEALNPRLNAFITVMAESALAEARAAERDWVRGRRRGALQGIPIAVKDNIWTRGTKTTAGSAILADFVPGEDAAVIRTLRQSGAVLVGKTNLNEFAYGITGENPHYGATHNPWNTDQISGGSSSGSAAATAAGLCAAALGTDTGGSIRVPAALCGVVGLKPTFGRISRTGIVPLALRFDHAGFLCRSVGDAALLLEALDGYDPRDEGSRKAPRKFSAQLAMGKKVKGKRWRIGRPDNFFWQRVDSVVWKLADEALGSLRKLGAEIEEIELPHLAGAIEPANLVAGAEARAFHQAAGYFPARAAEYAEDVRTRLEMGGEIRAVDYLLGEEAIGRARAEAEEALRRVDAIAFPTTPMAATAIGQEKVRIDSGFGSQHSAYSAGAEQTVRSALLRPNRPGNFTGLPAISVPCGFTPEGLPAGLQLIGRAFDEATLLRIAGAYEQQHDWSAHHPNIE